MQLTDILVHIDEPLSQSALETIEADIREGRGVAAASHQPGNPHLVQVVYDSDQTRMSSIVQDVRGHGLHAQGIGL
jgi:hypothetical protein